MWKNILLIVGVILAAVAVWLLFGMKDDTREQFINCKVENIQLTIQYQQCRDELLRIGHEPLPDPTLPGQDDSQTSPQAGSLSLVASPGGMITDPDPGGMITDPDPGDDLFAPTGEDLVRCGERNEDFREAVLACADVLENLEPK